MFRDRKDAGQKLAKALEKYKGSDGIVLAIPKGGVEVAYYVADYLQLPLSLIIVRKLPFPDNPEAGFGAIAEDGSIYLIDRIADLMPEKEINEIIEQQKIELQRRIKVLRKGKPLPQITGKSVILVDDGIAMGSTMQATIMLCKNYNAARIIVASPVAGQSTADELAKKVDDVTILEKPVFFRAVADAYRNWYDVSDKEVTGILKRIKLPQNVEN